MNKAEKLKRKIAHGLYLSVPKDVADDILEKMDEYAKQMLIAFRTQQDYNKDSVIPDVMQVMYKIDVDKFLKTQ